MGNIFSNKKDDKPETTRQRNRGALARNRGLSMLSMYKQHYILSSRYTCIVGKYKIYLQVLQKQIEKRAFGKLILYLMTIYVYCVYLPISKSPKHLPNCLKVAETSAVLILINGSSVTSELILLPFLSVAPNESGTRNTLLGL